MKIKINDIRKLTTVHNSNSNVTSNYKFSGFGSFDTHGYFCRTFKIKSLDEEVDGDKLLKWACKNGQFNLVNFLCETHELLLNNYNKTVVIASKNNHYATFTYLCERFVIPKKYVIESIRWSCINENLNIVKYINEKYDIQKEDIVGIENWVLYMICKKKCRSILTYLFEKFEFNINDFEKIFYQLEDDELQMLIINNLDPNK
jgi:hypothetical protein